jgi:hypothetical protein
MRPRASTCSPCTAASRTTKSGQWGSFVVNTACGSSTAKPQPPSLPQHSKRRHSPAGMEMQSNGSSTASPARSSGSSRFVPQKKWNGCVSGMNSSM